MKFWVVCATLRVFSINIILHILVNIKSIINNMFNMMKHEIIDLFGYI